jgi:hypothetical protein
MMAETLCAPQCASGRFCEGTVVSAVVQNSLQRTVLLLVVQHLALLNLEQHNEKAAAATETRAVISTP